MSINERTGDEMGKWPHEVRFTLSTFEKKRVKDGALPKLYECLTDARGPSSAYNNINNSQDGSRNAPRSSVEKRALVEFEIFSEIKHSWKRKVHVKISAFLIEMEVSPSMNKLNILD